jgi:hypothetical protein
VYAGYLALGAPDIVFANVPFVELVNSSRAYAYTRQAGIPWLKECDDCPETSTVVPGGGAGWMGPALDPAPWYDPQNPDTEGFLGVVGLEVTGAESSTRQAKVTQTIIGGGAVGPAYYAPKYLVVRALAIGADECGLQAGLDWMRYSTGATEDNCLGDTLTFFDCCPCVCESDEPSGPCGVQTYAELRDGPTACNPQWWPESYGGLKLGPPIGDVEWCRWVMVYRELRDGLPPWACCVDACVVPYLRQYRNTRIIEGPTVLRHPQMSCGAMAEVEFTIVAGDPTEYGTPAPVAQLLSGGTGGLILLGQPAARVQRESPRDRFGIGPRTVLPVEPTRVLQPVATVEQWARMSTETGNDERGNILRFRRPIVYLRTFTESTGALRVGVWRNGERLVGWTLAGLPEHAVVVIDGASRSVMSVEADGMVPLPGLVRDWDGGPMTWPDLPNGRFELTLDQDADVSAEVTASLSLVPAAAP